MTNVRERYNGIPIGVSGNYTVRGTHIAGFLATVSGTLTVTGTAADGTSAVTFVNALPVTAGQYVKIPLEVTAAPLTVTLAGGAAGTLFV